MAAPQGPPPCFPSGGHSSCRAPAISPVSPHLPPAQEEKGFLWVESGQRAEAYPCVTENQSGVQRAVSGRPLEVRPLALREQSLKPGHFRQGLVEEGVFMLDLEGWAHKMRRAWGRHFPESENLVLGGGRRDLCMGQAIREPETPRQQMGQVVI